MRQRGRKLDSDLPTPRDPGLGKRRACKKAAAKKTAITTRRRTDWRLRAALKSLESSVLPKEFERAWQIAFSGFKIAWSSNQENASQTGDPASPAQIQHLGFGLSEPLNA